VLDPLRLVDAADLQRRLDAVNYLVDPGLATALYLSLALGQPLLLEGEPGVGKTASAKALARALGAPLIRLQCYEGLTAGQALYEWNYQRQLLAIRLSEASHEKLADAYLFTEEFLQERPILQAIRHPGPVPPVLLIDEIDRADDEFEALLLEFLGESSITIPELGTFTAARAPIVVLTSNRSRELHDALRRRCLYHWIEFPSAVRAAEILRRSVPTATEPLIAAATDFVGRVRNLELDKAPGMAETIDWVSALAAIGATELAAGDVLRTIGTIAKTPDDRVVIAGALPSVLPAAPSSAPSSVLPAASSPASSPASAGPPAGGRPPTS
jgi:MoxR-like ATPase